MHGFLSGHSSNDVRIYCKQAYILCYAYDCMTYDSTCFRQLPNSTMSISFSSFLPVRAHIADSGLAGVVCRFGFTWCYAAESKSFDVIMFMRFSTAKCTRHHSMFKRNLWNCNQHQNARKPLAKKKNFAKKWLFGRRFAIFFNTHQQYIVYHQHNDIEICVFLIEYKWVHSVLIEIVPQTSTNWVNRSRRGRGNGGE